MTATMTPAAPETAPAAPAKGKAAPPVKIALSGDPSVQLLPPSVRDRAITRSRIRTGVLFIVLGMIIAIGLVAYGTLRAAQSQQALADANARTAEIIAQQAQYADAVALDKLIGQAEQLQIAATEYEVDWGPLFKKLISMLPAGAEILSIDASSVEPWKAPPTSDDCEDAPEGAIGGLSLSIATTTIQDATNYSRALAKVEGIGVSAIGGTAVGVDGRVVTSLGVVLTLDAVSGRFAVEEEGDPAESDDPAAEPTETATDAATTGEEG